MQSITKIGDGSHIHKINDSTTQFKEKRRRMSIEASNQLLLNRM
jgi:hypothetical protein